jgi:hypothetical protein
MERQICSKDESGIWALNALPVEFHGLIAQALAGHRDEKETPFDADALERFSASMQNRLVRAATEQAI